MSRMQAVDPSTAPEDVKELLGAVKDKFGMIPNMTKVMANSPAVLSGFLGLFGSLSGGVLDPKIREQIGLLTAQQNHCDYCLSAHSAIGKMVGLTQDQIVASREGDGSSGKATAALTFAKQVLDAKGHIQESDLEQVRAAGFSEPEIAEIIAHVALNLFTNYFNVATGVDIDFPKVSHLVVA
jgi:uncharacterized peroxidase-related enzyme